MLSGGVGLVMVVIVALVGGYAVVDWLTNVGSPGPFVCPAVGSTDVATPTTTTPGAPLPNSALDIAQRLTPSLAGGRQSLATRESSTTVAGVPEGLKYLFPDQFRPTDWSVTPGMNRVTSPFQYVWGTSALGNSDMGGVRSGEASVQVYDSPEARLAAEKTQAAEAKRTGNTWVCFADCGAILVGIHVKAMKTSDRGSGDFHNDDRLVIDSLAGEAQAALDSILGGCPAPEHVNRN